MLQPLIQLYNIDLTLIGFGIHFHFQLNRRWEDFMLNLDLSFFGSLSSSCPYSNSMLEPMSKLDSIEVPKIYELDFYRWYWYFHIMEMPMTFSSIFTNLSNVSSLGLLLYSFSMTKVWLFSLSEFLDLTTSDKWLKENCS